MRVSPSHIAARGASRTPSAHQRAGRMPIAAFMAVAPVVLSTVGVIVPMLIEGLIMGLANALEDGLKDLGERLSKGGK